MLRTLAPLRFTCIATFKPAFDLHVLSTPPAFVLSQNQTLRIESLVEYLSSLFYLFLFTQQKSTISIVPLLRGLFLNYRTIQFSRNLASVSRDPFVPDTIKVSVHLHRETNSPGQTFPTKKGKIQPDTSSSLEFIYRVCCRIHRPRRSATTKNLLLSPPPFNLFFFTHSLRCSLSISPSVCYEIEIFLVFYFL